MSTSLRIFMEYKIKPDKIDRYQEIMKELSAVLSEYGVESFEWFEAADQPLLYVEMFCVPTFSHYHTLKKWRQSKEHELFGSLDEVIEGGLGNLHCWAFYPIEPGKPLIKDTKQKE